MKDRSFKQVYDIWQPTHQAGASTMGCYSAAMNYFKPVWAQNIATITIDDLQDCMDDCPKGKRTQQNMKALCGLLYNTPFPGTWPGSTWRSFSGWAGSPERSGGPSAACGKRRLRQTKIPSPTRTMSCASATLASAPSGVP